MCRVKVGEEIEHSRNSKTLLFFVTLLAVFYSNSEKSLKNKVKISKSQPLFLHQTNLIKVEPEMW